MSTFTTHLYPCPPPTINALDAHQRTRLMRSTRKLGAVLGTTPHLLEPLPIGPTPKKQPSPSQIKALRREGKIFLSHSASSSVSSFSSYDSINSSDFYSPPPSPPSSNIFHPKHPIALGLPGLKQSKSKPSSKTPLPRPLLLRLHSVPLPPSDARVTPTPLSPMTSTPTSTSFLTPTPTTAQTLLSPLSPTFANTTPTPDFRRRKMAKLTRTLGENIPPELVFPPKASAGQRRSRHRSMSLSTLPSSTQPQPQPLTPPKTPNPSQPRLTAVGMHNASVHPISPSPFGSFAPYPSPKSTHVKSQSHSAYPTTPRFASKRSRSGSIAGSRVDAPAAETYVYPAGAGNYGRRKEREWSGEWNRRDMGEVLSGLRGLKGR